jgi:hypothetical protein
MAVTAASMLPCNFPNSSRHALKETPQPCKHLKTEFPVHVFTLRHQERVNQCNGALASCRRRNEHVEECIAPLAVYFALQPVPLLVVGRLVVRFAAAHIAKCCPRGFALFDLGENRIPHRSI